jgi:predicted phosphodiesterase
MAIKDIHEIVRLVKELNLDYGRPPLRQELESANVSRHVIQTHGFDKILAMAGLEPISRKELGEFKREKITNEIFKKSIYQQIQEHIPKKIESKENPKILCIGDIHFPFVHKQALEKLYEFCKENKPDYIVQMGDSVDFYSHSKFPRSHNEFTPQEEENMAREMLSEMWSQLTLISPSAKKYQILGNHCARPLKRVLESAPTLEHWVQKYFKEYFTFDGVETIFDHREELEINGIVFTHGFLGQEGKHRDFYLKNTVIGHLHKGWVQYRRFHNQTFWELCAGFLGDPEAKGLTYTPSKASNYQLGFGYIDKYGPRFISL